MHTEIRISPRLVPDIKARLHYHKIISGLVYSIINALAGFPVKDYTQPLTIREAQDQERIRIFKPNPYITQYMDEYLDFKDKFSKSAWVTVFLVKESNKRITLLLRFLDDRGAFLGEVRWCYEEYSRSEYRFHSVETCDNQSKS